MAVSAVSAVSMGCVEELEAQIERLKRELKTRVRRIGELESELLEVRALYAQERRRRSDVEDELEAIKAQLDSLQERVAFLEEDRERWQHSAAASRRHASILEAWMTARNLTPLDYPR